MKKIHLLTFLFLIVVLPYKGICTILHVPATYSSIQAGIDASVDGDIVLVEPGIYYENLNLNGKNIILCSNYFTTGNSAYITSTIIDGSNIGRVITINQGENSACQIVGLTIQNGNASTEYMAYGGGILIMDASPQILNSVIQNNYSPGFGGGVSIYGLSSGAKVLNCTIQNNTADSFGGGVYMGDCGPDAEVINCIISGNTITCNCDWNGGGGGVNLYHTGKLTNCLITSNSAPNAPAGGGGVYCDWGDYYGSQGIFVTGCTIVNNTALNWGGVSYVISGGEFRNCIIWGNIEYYGNISNYDGNSFVNSCTDPLPAGTGNISSDPAFVDPVSGNYRLSEGSPCINAGENAYNNQFSDLDGNSRIYELTIDMGAYEYGAGAGMNVQIGEGSINTDYFPIFSCYGYNYSQQIYLGSEIASGGGAAGLISKIRVYYSGGGSQPSNWDNWTVYLGNTAKTEFAGPADWVPASSLTQVFSGIIPDPVAGTWVEISLSTPFYYSGENIVVAVDENSGGWDCTALWGSFYSDAPRGLVFYDDNNNPDPASPPEANIGPEYWINQVQFEINTAVGIVEGYVTEEPYCTVPIEGATITTGSYSSTSDAAGYYQLCLPVGTYSVTALYHDANQTISTIEISEGATTTQDFCLQPFYAPPVSLQASLYGPIQNNVHLTWMAPGSIADQWIHWDNGTLSGALGYGGPGGFSVASRWPVSDIAPYTGTYLKKIRFIPTEATASYTLKVWKGSNASALLLTQVVNDPIINSWNEVTLDTPVLIDGIDEFWFGYEVIQTVGYPAGLGSGPAAAGKGDMFYNGYSWFSMKEAWGWEFNWLLQGFVSENSALTSLKLMPMVQNTTQQPILNAPIPALVKPQVVQLEQAPSAKLHSDLLKTSPMLPNSTNTTTFAPSSTVTGYNVYRDNVRIADNIPDLSYNDLSLPKGGLDYEVAAQYDFGESARIGPVHVDIYTCFPPTNLTVSNSTLTTTSANLSWTPSTISTNHQWTLEWGPAGFTQGYGTTVFINSTPGYSLANLIPGTGYDFYVSTYCSSTDASVWVKKTFRTHYFNCPVNAIAETETCGAVTNNGCEMEPSATGTVNCGDTICGTVWLHRSHRDSDWYSFTLTAPSDITLSCNFEFSSTFGIYALPCISNYSYVLYNTYGGGLTTVYTQLGAAGTYYIYMAPAYAEQVECDSLNRYWFTLKCNSCLTPTALNATNITATSANLVWSSNASLWSIEWGPAGFTKGTGTMITGTSSNPYTLNGLTMGYAYSYYVQSNCGSGTSNNWAGPYTFYIPCPANSLPYTEDFTYKSIGSTPQCWHVLEAGGPTNWKVDNNNYAGGVFPELIFIPCNPYCFYGRSYLASPVINTTGQTALNLSFKQYINSYNSGASCEVWTTSDGGVTWNSVWSLSQTGAFGPETTNLTISTPDVGSASFQFAFAVNGNSWDIDTWQIDDISLSESSVSKTLHLKVYLEGLYAGGGTMNQAYDDFGPHFGTGIADKVTVELHNDVTYGTVEYTSGLVDLSTGGDIMMSSIPADLSGSYYITIRHRNSIETTSAFPVSFSAGTINYSFDTPAKAFGDNLVLVNGKYCIYGGDVNQDGIVDSGDMIPVDNLSSTFGVGYVPEDANGDGLIDSGDMIIIDNNSSNFIGSILP